MKTVDMDTIQKVICLLVSCLLAFPGETQPIAGSPPGYPWLHNYPPREYRAHPQNFALVTDHQGILYAGNFAGVLQFDGSTWRLIETTNTTRVTALGIDTAGTVFVGARGELGCLASDSTGNMHFHSLLPDTFPENRFREVTDLYCTSSGIYFVSDHLLFRYHEGALEIWDPGTPIISGFAVGEDLYLQLSGPGLVRYTGQSYEPIPRGEEFSEAIEIRAMLPWIQNRILIATGTQGLYALDHEKGVIDIYTPSDAFFQQNLITDAIRLSDGTYAFGTSREGVIITDPDGNLIQVLNRQCGLQNDYVNALYAGPDQLWLALNNGIALLEVPGPFSLFDERKGLNGGVSGIIRFEGHLVVSTYEGIYLLDPATGYFSPAPGVITAGWSMLKAGKDLLAATSQGLYRIDPPRATLLKEGFCMALADGPKPGDCWLGGSDGLFLLRGSGNSWKATPAGFNREEIRWMMTDKEGTLWGATISGQILRMNEAGELIPLDTTNGLPGNAGFILNPFGGQALVSSVEGLYLWDEAADRFTPWKLPVVNDTTDTPWYSTLVEDPGGNLWITAGGDKEIAFFERVSNGFRKVRDPFLPLAGITVQAILPESDAITWMGGPDGLIRYDASVAVNTGYIPPALIRKVIVGSDSLVFGGNLPVHRYLPAKKPISLPYSENTVYFEFACPWFSPGGEPVFSYRLEGFEKNWSEWSPLDHKEYTNLPAGKYTFRVKARNLYLQVSPEASYALTIRAPWYQKWYSFLFYTFFTLGLLWLILVIRNRQLIREKQQLEKTITERTAEVVQQKEEIEKQSAELAFKNEELEKINRVVKAINSEIHFQNLLQSLLEKTRMIRAVENSTALVYDKELNLFRFTASFGWDVQRLSGVMLTLQQAEERYIQGSEEIYEDIFLKRDFTSFTGIPALDELDIPRSMLVLLIRVENRVEAFLILENMTRDEAFTEQDLSFIRNSKEHIISAFIKTRILADLQSTLNNLKETQDQLIQSEKLASLGQLTAGIAHEIQNPLNFVNNFSQLSAELADELQEIMEGIRDLIKPETAADIEEVVGMIRSNVQKINEHGKRASSIVKGMLQHSRGKSGEFEPTEINNLVTEYVNLAYHGMRAKDKSFNTALKTETDPAVGKAMVVPQDLSRVILNIVNNACYAVDEKAKKSIPGYAPEVLTTTRKVGDKIEIRIRYNGTGMPKEVIEKIFNPFFTTKPTGKGTGLGLSMSFDIITQIHKGKLEVQSQAGEYTEFIITITEKP